MVGKKEALRDIFSDMAIVNVPIKSRTEQKNTSGTKNGVEQPAPMSSPGHFNRFSSMDASK